MMHCYSQAFTLEALPANIASSMEVRFGCGLTQRCRQSSVEITLVDRRKPGDLPPQIVPVPVRLVMGLLRFCIHKLHTTRRARENRHLLLNFMEDLQSSLKCSVESGSWSSRGRMGVS